MHVDAGDAEAGQRRRLRDRFRGRGRRGRRTCSPCARWRSSRACRASTSGLMRRLTGAIAPRDGGDLREQLQLRLRFHVEAVDARIEREGELARRLADAGEEDLLGRHAGGERAAQLALRDDVGAGAEPRQRGDRPPGWSSPSAHRRSGGRGRRRPRRRRGSGGSASPSNSSRRACRPPPRSPAPARPRRGARRRDARNGASAGPRAGNRGRSGAAGAGWRRSRRGHRRRCRQDDRAKTSRRRSPPAPRAASAAPGSSSEPRRPQPASGAGGKSDDDERAERHGSPRTERDYSGARRAHASGFSAGSRPCSRSIHAARGGAHILRRGAALAACGWRPRPRPRARRKRRP